jgi:hypothetical protein
VLCFSDVPLTLLLQLLLPSPHSLQRSHPHSSTQSLTHLVPY